MSDEIQEAMEGLQKEIDTFKEYKAEVIVEKHLKNEEYDRSIDMYNSEIEQREHRIWELRNERMHEKFKHNSQDK